MSLYKKMAKSRHGDASISGRLTIICYLLCSLQLIESSGLNGTNVADSTQRKRAVDFPTLFYPGPDRKYITMAPPVKLTSDSVKLKKSKHQQQQDQLSNFTPKPIIKQQTKPEFEQKPVEHQTNREVANQNTFQQSRTKPETQKFSTPAFPPPPRKEQSDRRRPQDQSQFPVRQHFKPEVTNGARPTASEFRPGASSEPRRPFVQASTFKPNREHFDFNTRPEFRFSNEKKRQREKKPIFDNNRNLFSRKPINQNTGSANQEIKNSNHENDDNFGDRPMEFLRTSEMRKPLPVMPRSQFRPEPSFPVRENKDHPDGQRQTSLPVLETRQPQNFRSQQQQSFFKTPVKHSLFKSIVSDPNPDRIITVDWSKNMNFQRQNNNFDLKQFGAQSPVPNTPVFESWPTSPSRLPNNEQIKGFSNSLARLNDLSSQARPDNARGPFRQQFLQEQPQIHFQHQQQPNRQHQPDRQPEPIRQQQSIRQQKPTQQPEPSRPAPPDRQEQRQFDQSNSLSVEGNFRQSPFRQQQQQPMGADHNLQHDHGTQSDSSFSCRNQSPGYYADIESGCLIFHICNSNRQYTFMCPEGTLFSQTLLVCDWAQRIRCGAPPEDATNDNRLH